jgi:hypothetical protein
VASELGRLHDALRLAERGKSAAEDEVRVRWTLPDSILQLHCLVFYCRPRPMHMYKAGYKPCQTRFAMKLMLPCALEES